MGPNEGQPESGGDCRDTRPGITSFCMNEPLCFEIGSAHFARQLNLARDRAPVVDLARRSVDTCKLHVISP